MLFPEADDPSQDCRFFANIKLRVLLLIRGVFCAVLQIFFAVSDFCDIIAVVHRAIHANALAEFATLSDTRQKIRSFNGRQPCLAQKLDCGKAPDRRFSRKKQLGRQRQIDRINLAVVNLL